MQRWLSSMSIAIQTWTPSAGSRWYGFVRQAKDDHAQFCSLTPGERARISGATTSQRSIPEEFMNPFDAQLRAELLDCIPNRARTLRYHQP
eukprot:2146644-Amphidinium_carterae.3